jgi:hypothetical protein
MKLFFHKKILYPNNILDLIIDLYIDRSYVLLFNLDNHLILYAYVYIYVAIELFLEYIINNDYDYKYLEIYFLNCLKIVISLYDDICENDFSFEYIIYNNNYKYDDIIIFNNIQREVLQYYDYNFNMTNIIRNYMEEISEKKCKIISTYIRKQIFKKKFYEITKEIRIKKIINNNKKKYGFFSKN